MMSNVSETLKSAKRLNRTARASKISRFFVYLFASIGIILMLTGLILVIVSICSLHLSTNGVAATVNGVNISEDMVNERISNYRKSNNLESQQQFDSYLADRGFDKENFRYQIVSNLVQDEIENQLANADNIQVTDEECYKTINETRSQISDEELQSINDELGYSEETLLESCRKELRRQKLNSFLKNNLTVTDEDVDSLFSLYGKYINGSVGYYKLKFNFTADDKANNVLNDLRSGKISIEQAQIQYSDPILGSSNPNNLPFYSFLDSDYVYFMLDINDLNVGDISGVLKESDGNYVIKLIDKVDCDDDICFLEELDEPTKSNLRAIFQQMYKSNYEEDPISAESEKMNIEIFSKPLFTSY